MLVFVQSIERAKELFHELIYDGINVEVMHAERTQAQRDNIVKAFRSGKVQCKLSFILGAMCKEHWERMHRASVKGNCVPLSSFVHVPT